MRNNESNAAWSIGMLVAFLVAALIIGAVISHVMEDDRRGKEALTFEAETITDGTAFLWFEAETTGYCADECCCGEYADGITASGHVIKPGDRFCAAGPEFSFGDIFDIPEYGYAEVRDRGSAIGVGCLDLYFDTHEEALAWGRKKLKVRILRRLERK